MPNYAPTTFAGDGSRRDLVLGFAYLSKAHVNVTVGGVATSAYTWLNTSTIRLNTAPASGVLVVASRVTPGAPIVTWADGATILGADLNASATQAVYLADEANYAAGRSIGLSATVANAWDAAYKRVINISTPVDAGDATPKSWVTSQIDAVTGTVQTALAAHNSTVAGQLASQNTTVTNQLAAQNIAVGAQVTAAASSATAAGTAKTAAEAARDLALSYRDAAQTYANAAASSVVSASSALDAFDDRYLGQKASDPAVDNDGDALVFGALYFNTTLSKMKVWTGASWALAFNDTVAASAVPNDSSVSGTTVKDALNTLKGGFDKLPTSTTAKSLAAYTNTSGVLGVSQVFEDANGNMAIQRTPGAATNQAALALIGAGRSIAAAANGAMFYVDAATGYAGSLFEFRLNGVARAVLSAGGTFNVDIVGNTSSANNAQLALATTGTTVSRNVADANAALTVTQTHASSTGDVLVLRNNATAVLSVSRAGVITFADGTTLGTAPRYNEIVVDITSTTTYTLPDPATLNNGDSRIVRFNGTNSTNGVCAVSTTGSKNIVYLTTGTVFYTPGRGEVVQFQVHSGVYVAIILQSGLPFSFTLTGTGSAYTPSSSWTRSSLTALTGDSVYRRTVSSAHANVPCHGIYSLNGRELVANNTSGNLTGYAALGTAAANTLYDLHQMTFAVGTGGHLKPCEEWTLLRDAEVSQWILSTGLQYYGSNATLTVTYLGR